MKKQLYEKHLSLDEMIEIWREKPCSKGFLNSLICNLICERENKKKKYVKK